MDAPPSKPPGDDVLRLGGETMGTTWSVGAVAPPGVTEADLLAAVQAELDAVVAVFSPWEPTSEISRFNAAPEGVFALSEAFWSVLDASMDLADDTDGAVDPTLGSLVDLWGFGPPGPRIGSPVPLDDEIAAALTVSSWRRLRLDRDARGAFQPGGMKLDFSGIAKGHAVDLVSKTLSRLGATSHLVEIGGEMRGRGVKPDGQPWWIGLEQPPGAPSSRTVAALVDIAVATSGDWRRAFEHEGRVYPHTIDGSTGRPIENGVASVTVFHASAMTADAWATALTVLGPEAGPATAEAYDLAAQIVVRTAHGIVEHLTPAFVAMMDEDDAG